MKTILPTKLIMISCLALIVFASCSRPTYYTSPTFSQLTAKHKIIAVLPAEMIYTGTAPKNMTPETIAQVEEQESKAFQQSLYNGILDNANTRKHVMTINVQDISTTLKLLDDNHISVRECWAKDDRELARVLGVDAVVRMRIQKKRYMSDLASYGIGVGRQVLGQVAAHNNVFMPYVPNKTNDIIASCNLVSNSMTLWNDSYRGTANWNNQPEMIINDITNNFGRHFPYKRRI